MTLSRHTPFRFKSGEQLLEKAEELGFDLPYQESIDILLEPFVLCGRRIPNRIVVQPMEGCDSNPDGSPSDLTLRRYERYAKGGNGTIWFEAVSVMREGRSNPRQLWINDDNIGDFKSIVEQTRNTAYETFGRQHDPYLVLQLTHSGRFSKPDGKLLGKVGAYNPYLNDSKDIETYSDAELHFIRDKFIEAVKLADEAGFDSVDIKVCHGYLLHELLCNRTESDSKYSGELANRMGLLLEIIELVRDEVPKIMVSVRFNAYDGFPYPYGFGVSKEKDIPAMEEPQRLVKELIDHNCRMFNVTAGIPAANPQISRPFDKALPEMELPEEHPLEGVTRLIELCKTFQKLHPEIPFVGTGYSYLRQYWPNVAANAVAEKMASLIGLGRGSFAYPDAPLDLMEKGKLDSKKVCITCSKCSELMKNGKTTGCVVRDNSVYGEVLRK